MGISLSTEDKHTLGETLRPLGVNIRCWKNPSPVATATSRKEEQDPRAEGWRKGQILLGESRVAFSLTHGPPPPHGGSGWDRELGAGCPRELVRRLAFPSPPPHLGQNGFLGAAMSVERFKVKLAMPTWARDSERGKGQAQKQEEEGRESPVGTRAWEARLSVHAQKRPRRDPGPALWWSVGSGQMG